MRNTPLISLVCLLALQGCASKTPSTPTVDSESAEAIALRNRLTNADHGLEIRRWNVPAQPAQINAALAQHADRVAADAVISERLQRNGLSFVRVPLASLEPLLVDLGGSNIDRNEWHGQIPEWRSLLARPVDREGQAVAIDGRVRRFDRGEMRLMIRAWTVQMEDGPSMHLEVLPRHHAATTATLLSLLGNDEPQGEGFASMAIDLQLEAGWAYVLQGESPLTLGSTRVDGTGARPAASPRRSQTGPIDMAGPEAAAPPTMGEFLLGTSTAAPSRPLMVFVPRVPESMFIPPAPDDDANRPVARATHD